MDDGGPPAGQRLAEWFDRNVVCDTTEMPPKTADNCPGWKPKGQDDEWKELEGFNV